MSMNFLLISDDNEKLLVDFISQNPKYYYYFNLNYVNYKPQTTFYLMLSKIKLIEGIVCVFRDKSTNFVMVDGTETAMINFIEWLKNNPNVIPRSLNSFSFPYHSHEKILPCFKAFQRLEHSYMMILAKKKAKYYFQAPPEY
jgi:hypothetical protein